MIDTAPKKRQRTARAQPRVMQSVINKSWDYLNKNFTKFDKKTRLHVALEIAKRTIPQDNNYPPVPGGVRIVVVRSEGKNSQDSVVVEADAGSGHTSRQ